MQNKVYAVFLTLICIIAFIIMLNLIKIDTSDQMGFIMPSIIFVLILSFTFVNSYKKAHMAEALATSTIRGVAVGPVELHAEFIGTPIQNLRGFSCTYYKYIIQQYRRSGKHGRWHDIATIDSNKTVKIRDQTGEATLNINGFELETAASLISSSKFSTELKAACASKGISIPFFSGSLRAKEYLLIPTKKYFIWTNLQIINSQPIFGEGQIKNIITDVSQESYIAKHRFYWTASLVVVVAILVWYGMLIFNT